MSEPVTNVEIEDVLSSIRRLVTESGSKPAEKAIVIEEAERVSGEAPESVNGTEAFAEKGESEVTTDDALTADTEPAEDTLDKLVLTQALRVSHLDEDDEKGEDVDGEGASEASGNAQADEVQSEKQPEEISEEYIAPELPEETASEDSFKGRIELLETAVASQSQDWEDDGENESSDGAEPFDALQWEDHGDDASFEEATDDEPADERSLDGSADEEAREFDFLSDDTLIDEDMLREMVSDIVRQELQGALGERITRNVRKLVRREIHRALMAQELE